MNILGVQFGVAQERYGLSMAIYLDSWISGMENSFGADRIKA
jgi:hypothetical protein